MLTKSATRVEAIFCALLVDEYTPERAELAASGVSAHRIESLYPYDFSTLTSGLDAYMNAGKCIDLNLTFEINQAIAEKSLSLYKLLPNDQITAAGNRFNTSEPIDAIVRHPGTAFNKVDGKWSWSGSHESQASGLVTRLNWGLLYARQSSNRESAGDYLESLVDNYLPELLREHELTPPKPKVARPRRHFWRR